MKAGREDRDGPSQTGQPQAENSGRKAGNQAVQQRKPRSGTDAQGKRQDALGKKRASLKGKGRRRGVAHVPTDQTRNMIALAAMAGLTQDRAGAMIGVGKLTIQRHYAAEWERGTDHASMKVVGNLYRMATATTNDRVSVAAAIFWAKARLGWRERPQTAEAEAMPGPEGKITVRLKLFEDA